MDTEVEHLVGFVGLGAMGLGMAQSLLRAGFAVRGYDIDPTAVEAFERSGGQPVRSAADAATGAGVLIIMVLNAEQANDVLFGSGDAAERLSPGTVVLLCSTVKPASAQEMALKLAKKSVDFLDAPVSGGTVRAANGSLTVMASGSPKAFRSAEGVLDAMSEHVYCMGDLPGQGSTMKLVNQILVGINLAASAEAVAFGANAGIDPKKVYEVICNSAGASWVFEDRVPHILENDYTPLSAVDIWIKDLGIVLEAGRENQFPLPLSAIAHQIFTMAAAAGYGRLDDSAVVKVFEKIAGFEVVSDKD